MLHRPPARRRKRRSKKHSAAELRKRERDRERQREKRKRDRKGVVMYRGRVGPAVIEAMIARNKFFGASKEEAERDAIDPEKIAALALGVLNEWALTWYSKK